MVMRRDDVPIVLKVILRYVPPDKVKALLRDMRRASDNRSFQETVERLQLEADRWLEQNKR